MNKTETTVSSTTTHSVWDEKAGAWVPETKTSHTETVVAETYVG